MAETYLTPSQLKYLRLIDDGDNKEIQQVYWQNTVDSVLIDVTNANNNNAQVYTLTANYNNPTLRNIIERLGELAFLDVNTSSGGVVNITVQTAEVANNVSSSLENTIKSWISNASVNTNMPI